MNEEVKETIKILQNNSLVKSGSYEFIGDSDITYAEIYILLKFIEDLQQENKQLHEELEWAIGIVEHNRIISKKDKEIHQLKEKLDCDLQWALKYEKQVGNWNKLKEYLINDINYWEEQEKEWIKLGFIKFGGEANSKIIFKKVLDKMQELQGSDNK